MQTGVLYVVATPIGNLDDMTPRAVQTLSSVDQIAAEDTRHSRVLLQHFGIRTPLLSLHEHNERAQTPKLIERMRQGASIALITDAGTPLISDPGYHLVSSARRHGVRVIPVPGASALLCALSVGGLPTDRFVFEGFLPNRAAARRARLRELSGEHRTLVFFEASHRIVESLSDMALCFGDARHAVLARELTKAFETVHDGPLGEMGSWVQSDPNQQRGEFVILVQGAAVADPGADAEVERVLRVLLADLPVRQAAGLAAQILNLKKNDLYRRALALQRSDSGRQRS